jgi:two-component system NtrC family sensor kinase
MGHCQIFAVIRAEPLPAGAGPVIATRRSNSLMPDIVTPAGMSGLELTRMLRQHRPERPVLLATGYSQYVAQVVGAAPDVAL